jgi:hypothetical protein
METTGNIWPERIELAVNLQLEYYRRGERLISRNNIVLEVRFVF